MEYRRLGESNVDVTVISFGAWAIGGWLWGGADARDAVAAVRTGVELGMTTIDTAPIYGFGLSEELVAEAVKPFRRDEVQLLTKFALRWDMPEGEYHFETKNFAGESVKIYKNARRESIIHECEESLRRLKTDYIDLYQCHWRDNTTPVEEMMETLVRLTEQGKIRAAGVSNFTAAELAACRRVGPVAASQPPYSMINRGAEAEMIPYCIANKVGVLAYSPLQRGLLTGKFRAGQTYNEGDHRPGTAFFKDGNITKVNLFLETLRPIAKAHQATLGQIVIAWTIRQPGITAALVGARDAKQVKENAAAADIRLSDEELTRINGQLNKLKLDL
ncbi:MAG: aldo/keto reductase [Planctomycetota bacterium]|nr:aldo/keto reductase [Planctomycetota bacterium]